VWRCEQDLVTVAVAKGVVLAKKEMLSVGAPGAGRYYEDALGREDYFGVRFAAGAVT
jgi:hypothetical protein